MACGLRLIDETGNLFFEDFFVKKKELIMKTTQLISELQTTVQGIIETVEAEILPLNKAALNWKPAPEAWSILECFEHLNRYNRFYNAELERALARSARPAAFQPGWLGNYFVQSISPGNTKPMKTMKHLNPLGSKLGVKVLEEFLAHQRHLLELLGKAKGANLNQRLVKVEILPLLRLKTGDAFRFVVAHEQRHLQQAIRLKGGGADTVDAVDTVDSIDAVDTIDAVDSGQ